MSYQFDAFFSYFYILKHENFLRLRKHWWHLQAEHAFTNTKCMKMGYNRVCACFGRVSCTALIPAPHASFMVQFPVVPWGLHRDGIIMVSCSAFYGAYMTSAVSVMFLYPSRNDCGPQRNCTLHTRVIRVPSAILHKL